MFVKNLVRSITGDILGGVAFGAGMALVNEFVDSRTGRNSIPAGNYVPQSVPNNNNGTTIANIALARIALCYYIAKADGSISPEEQTDLDYMCSSLMNNPNASSTFRSELQSIVNDRSTSFMNVEKYLNRLDPNTLSSLEADARRIAELSGGVSDTESKALSVFQNYVYGKQGFPGSNMNEQFAGKARVINLKCSGCAADLEINPSMTETYCPYCGSRQIIVR